MKKRNKLVAFILAAATALTVISGCGGKAETEEDHATDQENADANSAEESKTKPAEADEAEVLESTALGNGEITVGYGTAIDSLTPFRNNTGRNAPYLVQLYETLAVLDSEQELQPYVAKSWETNDNGYTYEIEIWDNVTDSAGNHITAADIVWFVQESMDRGLKPSFAKAENIEQTGDYTFSIKLTTNMVGALNAILMDTYVISQAEFEASSDEFGTAAVTTSPYICTEFTASASIAFERRDDYWGDIENLPECVRPLVKKVNYIMNTEASQLGIALETGEVDCVIDMASSTGIQFVDMDGYTVDLADGPSGWQIYFSGAETSPCAKDQLLRQAICYGIDEQGLITGIASGYGTQMWDVFSPVTVGFNDEWKNEEYYEYNLEKAKELLKESDYNGETITILSSSSATASRLAQLLQNYLIAMGIDCEVNSVDMALFTSIRLDGTQYDIIINTVGGYSLADVWAMRFDMNAYETGDATSRHDDVLAELLYKTWTYDGWTDENIDAVHEYLKENAIGYGLVNPQVFSIWRDDAGIQRVVKGGISDYVIPSACQLAE